MLVYDIIIKPTGIKGYRMNHNVLLATKITPLIKPCPRK